MAAMTMLKPVWNDRSISLNSKIRLTRSLVTSIFFYTCESWTLTAELQRRIQAMEMRCYRKILRVSYKDHVTNEEVCAKIQRVIGLHEDLLTIVNKRRLSCLPSIRSGQNRLARHSKRREKTRQTEEEVGRQHQGMHRPGFGKSQRAVENREKWRKVVAKSSVVPQRPSRLRD